MGDRIDLEDVFRAHQREIFVYFLRTLGHRQAAEDLAQETFVRACRSALLYRGEASVRTWLFAIARRTLADHLRRRAPEHHPVETPETVDPSAVDPSTRVALQETLASLPIVPREAIVLCDVIGFSPAEAAEMVGVTANAFRVRLHRARRRFRDAYGHDV